MYIATLVTYCCKTFFELLNFGAQLHELKDDMSMRGSTWDERWLDKLLKIDSLSLQHKILLAFMNFSSDSGSIFA